MDPKLMEDMKSLMEAGRGDGCGTDEGLTAALAELERLAAVDAACARVNPLFPLAPADALVELLDVAERCIRHFGGYPEGPCVTDAPLEKAARAARIRAKAVR